MTAKAAATGSKTTKPSRALRGGTRPPESGRRTSIYLTTGDIVRIASAGNPTLIDLVREALDAREQALMNANSGRGDRNVKTPDAKGVAGLVGGRPKPEECPHPRARRDTKSGMCRACGTPANMLNGA